VVGQIFREGYILVVTGNIMSKRSIDPRSVESALHGVESAPMEQVRELLFGAQLKDMETRFQRQEERSQREITDLRNALKTRIDSLENFMKSEVASLLHRLKDEQDERAEMIKAEQRERNENQRAEQRERTEAIAQVTKDLTAANEAFERKLAKLSSTLDNAERELRQLLQTESGALSAKVDERYQDALNVLSKTASEIRGDMVYRSSFSTMLTEMAVKLSGQWALDVMPQEPVPEPVEEPSL
jgi:chromosome segregation ATPase